MDWAIFTEIGLRAEEMTLQGLCLLPGSAVFPSVSGFKKLLNQEQFYFDPNTLSDEAKLAFKLA